MRTNHSMMYEGRGGARKTKKKAVKTKKRGSVISGQLRAAKRQAWNLLGAVGLVVVTWWLIQLALGGG